MNSPFMPDFSPSPVSSIPAIASRIHRTFSSHRTRSLDYRIVQLRRLYWALVDFEPLFTEALHGDLRKPAHETILNELDLIRDDCVLAINSLKKWARDENISELPLAMRVFRHAIRKDPIGPSLIIGAYNFPALLSLQPLVGAIAAGCTAVVKPSENAPATAAAIEYIVRERLDNDAFVVVNGAVEHATALLDAGDGPETRWAKICYTGNCTVAKVIARRAAETLTPCLFELGGLNPAIVTRSADLDIAARRLLWCTVINSGQLCTKQNYVLVERAVQDAFVRALRRQLGRFFPQGVRESPDYARMINERQFRRVKGIVERSRGEVVVGGEMDESELFIEPTFVLVHSVEDSTVAEEAFGPVSAVMPFDTLDEAIGIANRVCSTPLSLSTFGSSIENEKVLDGVASGGASCNDSFLHAALAHAPFGGIGTSGTGAYRGKASFDAFTHRRTIARVPGWADRLLRLRYPPYQAIERTMIRLVAAPSIDFDREGRKVRGLKWCVVWLFRGAGVTFVVKLLVVAALRALGTTHDFHQDGLGQA